MALLAPEAYQCKEYCNSIEGWKKNAKYKTHKRCTRCNKFFPKDKVGNKCPCCRKSLRNFPKGAQAKRDFISSQ